MAQMRVFNEKGVKAFGRAIQRLEGTSDEPPYHLLDDPEYTEEIDGVQIELEPGFHSRKRSWVEYIDLKFAAAGYTPDNEKPGIWEWLTLLFWDSACQRDRSGKWLVRKLEKYLIQPRTVDPSRPRRSRRHLLREPFRIYRAFLKSPLESEHQRHLADLVLLQPLWLWDDASNGILERPRVGTSAAAVLAASMLYYDRKSDRVVQDRKRNDSLREFCKSVQRMPVEYDLGATSYLTILSHLPPKFDDRIRKAGMWDLIREIRVAASSSSAGSGRTGQGEMPTDPLSIAEILRSLRGRDLKPSLVPYRADQFRAGVIGAYGHRCAITGIGLRTRFNRQFKYEVQAAHIIPVASDGPDLVENGLALTGNVHWAFDQGLIWVERSSVYRVKMSDDFYQDVENEWLRKYRNEPLSLPDEPRLHPDPDFLDWHANNVARR